MGIIQIRPSEAIVYQHKRVDRLQDWLCLFCLIWLIWRRVQINDARPLYDMMAITLENLPSIQTVARATLGSLLILSHVISLTSVSSNIPMIFPEALLQQILKAMVHPDIDTRVGAHHIFSAIVVRVQAI